MYPSLSMPSSSATMSRSYGRRYRGTSGSGTTATAKLICTAAGNNVDSRAAGSICERTLERSVDDSGEVLVSSSVEDSPARVRIGTHTSVLNRMIAIRRHIADLTRLL